MPNSLRIIKADGTSHIVPLRKINAHRRLNSVLPFNQQSRFEEIDEKGNVVKVHHEGARGEALAGQNEIARLRAENERLRAAQADAQKEPVEAVIAKINAATSRREVQDISLVDKRKEVMKAAVAKIKSLPTE